MFRICRSLISNKNITLIKSFAQTANNYTSLTTKVLLRPTPITQSVNLLKYATYSTTTPYTRGRPRPDFEKRTNDYIPVEDDLSFAPKSHNKENIHVYESDKSDFSNFDIPQLLANRLKELGYDKPFPIQEATLKHTLAGKDLIGKAVTGSGKTLAFAIPIISKILNSPNKASRFPKALVLSPTRELCMQLQRSIQELAPSLKCISIYGGTQLENQVRQLNGHVDVVCATPGRLRDLLERKNFNKDHIELVCLDEADELLTPNFIEQIEDVLDTKQPKQMLMFSATINKNVDGVVRKYLNDPVVIDLTDGQQQKLPENVKHFIMDVPFLAYTDTINHLIKQYNSQRCIVFTRSKRTAVVISEQLSGHGIRCSDLHSDHSQSKRERVFREFRRGNFTVLIATDVASRGLDIPEIDLVINCSVPPSGLDYYIHRSGRTGRGGRPGVSVLLHSNQHDEVNILRDIQRLVKFQQLQVPDELKEKVEQARLSESSRPPRRPFNNNRFSNNDGFERRNSFSRDDGQQRSFDRPPRRDFSNNRFDSDRPRFTNRFSNEQGDRPKFTSRFSNEDSDRPRFQQERKSEFGGSSGFNRNRESSDRKPFGDRRQQKSRFEDEDD